MSNQFLEPKPCKYSQFNSLRDDDDANLCRRIALQLQNNSSVAITPLLPKSYRTKRCRQYRHPVSCNNCSYIHFSNRMLTAVRKKIEIHRKEVLPGLTHLHIGTTSQPFFRKCTDRVFSTKLPDSSHHPCRPTACNAPSSSFVTYVNSTNVSSQCVTSGDLVMLFLYSFMVYLTMLSVVQIMQRRMVG